MREKTNSYLVQAVFSKVVLRDYVLPDIFREKLIIVDGNGKIIEGKYNV